ncbi:MAG TPA: hypothetical protein DEA50_10405, partial [Parvularcula sp.]|nr:hypothetical protein [Parvularcula sp.]
MILRRVMQHVKRQDWFAVMLDFVIVVLGVFVATQVSNWNEAGAERRRERAYLQRIHDDVASLRASTAEADHTAKEVSGLLNEAMGALASGEDARIANLGAHYCTAIVRSHIFATPIVTPPAIEEVLQSGEVGIIVDQELRTAIVRYYQEIEDMSQLRSDLQIDRRALGRTYPN